MTDGNHSGFVGNKAHWPLAVLRVYTGVFFLIYGFGKLQRGGAFADGMSGFLNAQENTFAFIVALSNRPMPGCFNTSSPSEKPCSESP